MNKRSIITGLVAAVIGAASMLGSYSNNITYAEEKTVVNVQEGNKKIMSGAAEDYLYDFMKGDNTRTGYIDFMAKNSDEIRKNIKLTSREQVIKGYAQFHKMCLDVAVLHLFQKVDDKDVSELAERLRQHQKTLAKETYINYDDPKVKEGYLPLARNRVEFFKQIIESNVDSPSNDFKVLIRRTFTKEGFKESLVQYQEARVSLYGGFADSLKKYQDPNNKVWAWLIRIFGPGIAKSTGEKSDEINMKELERIYGKN